VSQSDVPAFSLDRALRIARAIGESYAFSPTAPLDVAVGLTMSPASSQFRMLCGASIAYGLTEGGYNAPAISTTALARRILEPTVEGDEMQARREASLRPRVLREFLAKYEGNRFPREDIARNVLAAMGVPRDSVERTFNLILETGKAAGFFREIKGTLYVHLNGVGTEVVGDSGTEAQPEQSARLAEPVELQAGAGQAEQNKETRTAESDGRGENRKVFIAHGKNRALLESLKNLLSFGELEPVISVERESVSQPLSDKVFGEMRECGAAIIHVDAEKRLRDPDNQTIEVVLNPNVLTEIGAAIALYGKRLILLVKDEVELPSDLKGLYYVLYSGDKLDGETTLRLLKAIQEMKNHSVPKIR